MPEENKALYRRMTEVIWNKGDLDAIDEFFAPDVIIHSAPPEWPAGSAGVKATVTMWRGAFPDFELASQFVIAEGDKVANYWTISGTHSEELLGVPATGKHIKTYGMSLVRFAGGKIVEIWSASDQLGLMRELGAIPS
jgi:steroid delta-isomerase-like uncharacterized protein